jgi:uridine kinase
MYKGKCIITIDGKAGSGKSTVCSLLSSSNVKHIDLDQIVTILTPRDERLDILNANGIEYLESILFPELLEYVLQDIESSFEKVILVDGIKASTLMSDYSDHDLTVVMDEYTRLNRLLAREGSNDRVDFIEGLTN